MVRNGTNFDAGSWTVGNGNPKAFIGGALKLTGCELSLGFLSRGTGSPFVHSHRRNEETYIVVNGAGVLHVDGEEFPIASGSVVRVASAGKRALRAADDEDLVYYCIQADTGSLMQATGDDGVIEAGHPTSWLPA